MKRTLFIIAISIIIVILVDLLWSESQGYFAWSRIPGFFALFGLIGGVAIVLISKWLGHYWLQRKGDYYEGKDVDE